MTCHGFFVLCCSVATSQCLKVQKGICVKFGLACCGDLLFFSGGRSWFSRPLYWRTGCHPFQVLVLRKPENHADRFGRRRPVLQPSFDADLADEQHATIPMAHPIERCYLWKLQQKNSSQNTPLLNIVIAL